MEEDIIKKFENFCEDLYYWVDDDMGGHFETVVGNQIANTMLGYLSYKEDLENLLTRYKQLEEENRIYGLEGCRVRLKMYIDKNYIPTSKVRGKIEELDIQISECEYADDDIEERKQDIEKEKRLLLRDKKTLQELLGEE